MTNFSLLQLRAIRALLHHGYWLHAKCLLTVLLQHPQSCAGRLIHALQGVSHHLAGGAGSLRGSVSRHWPRRERGARLRVAVEGEISTGGATREAEYRPLLKHA